MLILLSEASTESRRSQRRRLFIVIVSLVFMPYKCHCPDHTSTHRSELWGGDSEELRKNMERVEGVGGWWRERGRERGRERERERGGEVEGDAVLG